jgi:hypothetical protein
MKAVLDWLDTGVGWCSLCCDHGLRSRPGSDPRCLVIFVDGFDCVALGPPTEFVAKWAHHFPADRVVFSADRDAGALGPLLFGPVRSGDRRHPYRRLVSGLYCGTGPVVYRMLQRVCVPGRCQSSRTDDQREFTRFCLDRRICTPIRPKCPGEWAVSAV